MNEYKNIERIIVLFNLVTIVLYLFPPIVTNYNNKYLVVAYLLTSVMLMRLGFRRGQRKAHVKLMSKNNNAVASITGRQLTFFFVFYSLTFLVRYGYLLGYSPTNISGMFDRLIIGAMDSRVGYQLTSIRGSSPVPWSLYVIVCLVDQIFFILVLVNWRYETKIQKLLGLIFIFIELFYWVGCGTSFGVIAMLTNILFVYNVSPIGNDQKRQKKRGRKLMRAILVAGLFAIAVTFFSYNLNGRLGGDSDQALSDLMNHYQFQQDSFILNVLPESLWSSYYYVYSYLCQGYDALANAMSLDVCWTKFLGSSPSLMHIGHLITGYDAFQDSYMVALESCGIDATVNWHSAYLWWANDFTIPGALVIVYILSLICGFACVDCSQTGNILSKIVFVVFANMLLFMFANNTYLANVFYPMLLVFPIWLYKRVLK